MVASTAANFARMLVRSIYRGSQSRRRCPQRPERPNERRSVPEGNAGPHASIPLSNTRYGTGPRIWRFARSAESSSAESRQLCFGGREGAQGGLVVPTGQALGRDAGCTHASVALCVRFFPGVQLMNRGAVTALLCVGHLSSWRDDCSFSIDRRKPRQPAPGTSSSGRAQAGPSLTTFRHQTGCAGQPSGGLVVFGCPRPRIDCLWSDDGRTCKASSRARLFPADPSSHSRP
jgi:hypothetical protein